MVFVLTQLKRYDHKNTLFLLKFAPVYGWCAFHQGGLNVRTTNRLKGLAII